MGFRPLRRLVVPTFPCANQIPKILHQTFRTRELRPELAASVAGMKRRNPEWDYRFYDDADVEEYVLTHYGPDFLTYFRALNPRYTAARADLFRYLVIYREGGLYLDIKSHASKPLSEVLEPTDRFLIAQWRNRKGSDFPGWGLHAEIRKVQGGEFQQWFIAAAPGHPFLKATIESVLRNIRRYSPLIHGVGKNAVLRITGPIVYTRAIEPILGLHPHRMVDSASDLGLEYSIYANQDHQSVLGTHYSSIAEALVGTGYLTTAAVELRRCLKILRRTLVTLR